MDPPSALDTDSDPRITGEYVRELPGAAGTVTLVGVVHDHPASSYRVRRAVTELDPDVLALELPPLSIPLFEQYADTDRDTPVFGGEMSAAIRAADTDATVGIDGPTGGFLRRLGRELLRERPSRETARTVLSDVVDASTQAVTCRAAATVAAGTPVRLEVDSPTPHDVDRADPPETQACDERTQVRRSNSFMGAFRATTRRRASRIEDAAREAEMTARLDRLRETGDVVAVVGIDHLDAVADRLRRDGEAASTDDTRDHESRRTDGHDGTGSEPRPA